MKSCPKCNISWWSEENIYDYFRRQGDSKEKAAETAAMYGCTKDNPKHFGINHVGIETPDYDGISYWQCTACGARFDRWTMEEVKHEE